MCVIKMSHKAEHPTVSYSLHPELVISKSITIFCKQKSFSGESWKMHRPGRVRRRHQFQYGGHLTKSQYWDLTCDLSRDRCMPPIMAAGKGAKSHLLQRFSSWETTRAYPTFLGSREPARLLKPESPQSNKPHSSMSRPGVFELPVSKGIETGSQQSGGKRGRNEAGM